MVQREKHKGMSRLINRKDSVADWILQGFDRALEQSSDAIRAKSSWLNRDRGDVENWLTENGYLTKSGGKL